MGGQKEGDGKENRVFEYVHFNLSLRNVRRHFNKLREDCTAVHSTNDSHRIDVKQVALDFLQVGEILVHCLDTSLLKHRTLSEIFPPITKLVCFICFICEK